jgi:hypothetical protein
MAEQTPELEANGDAGTPRWVKVFGIISLIVVLLFIVRLVTGGDGHGPGRHLRPASDTGRGVQQP